MTGRVHHPKEIKQMVVFIEHHDGSVHGYEVFDGQCSWSWTGIATSERGGTGSAALVTIAGRFHRRSDSGRRLEDLTMKELP